MAYRVLVVEDDSLQAAILRSALEKRGYETDGASDGLSAVTKLRQGGFDLALIDYRLPEIDGLASARLMHELLPEAERPRLIAVTADEDSLQARAGAHEAFDEIVTKQLDLPALLAVVEAHLRGSGAAHAARAAAATWRELGLLGPPAAWVVPEPSPAQAQMLRTWFDLSGQAPPQLVLLLGPEAAIGAAQARGTGQAFALPFVDLAGAFDGMADARFMATDRASWVEVAATIGRFAAHAARLRPELLLSADTEMRLLAYIFVSGRSFAPEPDPTSRQCLRYPGLFPQADLRRTAERLAGRGLLERRFVDRLHACPSCGSSRLTVREECPSCRSADLREVALVHHFRCAHQAPETAFVRGAHLVCPKCSRQLRHYGSDYDKPGSVFICGGCGSANADPAIGFSCLDCSAHTDAAATPTQDVFAYSLTAAGIEALTRPALLLGSDGASPEKLQFRGEITYGAAERIRAAHGDAALRAMRRLFMENLVHALDGDCLVVSEPDRDVLLVRHSALALPAGLDEDLMEACQGLLAERLLPHLRAVSPVSNLA